MRLGYGMWTVAAIMALASHARAEVDLKMEVATTSMSIAAPELQVLIRNEGDERGSYQLQIRGAKQEGAPACNLTAGPLDDHRPGNAWREYLIGGVTGSIAAHGFAHRIHAFRSAAMSPCVVEVQLIANGSSLKKMVTVSGQLDSVKPNAIEPKISGHGWAERDFLAGPLLVHVIARNESTSPQTLAILRREISCKDPDTVSWSLLRDVPQGLSAGPVAVPGRGWAGFVSVVELPVHRKDAQCTASFDIAYERMPRGYAVIEKVQVPLQDNSGWSWSVPEGQGP